MENATRSKAHKLLAEGMGGPDVPGVEAADYLWEFYTNHPSAWPQDKRGTPPKRLFYAWVELEALSLWVA